MRLPLLLLAVFLLHPSILAFADTAVPATVVTPPKVSSPVMTTGSPVQPSAVTSTTAAPVPAGTPSEAGITTVATPSAPPTWAQDLIVTAEKLPVVGPLIAKFLLYLGILSSILTVLVGSVLTILSALMGAFNAASLTEAATAVATFRDGKVMYWLRFFSLFNAKKPDAK